MDRVNKSYNTGRKRNAHESRDFRRRTFSGVERRRELISSGFYTDKIFEELIPLSFIHVGPSGLGIGVLVRVVAQRRKARKKFSD